MTSSPITDGIRLVACLAMLIGLPAQAENNAEEKLVSANEPEAILNLARGFGSADLEKDSSGDPMIVGRIDGTKYVIFFYGCDTGRACQDIAFTAIWTEVEVSMDVINAWNRDKRYGKAYLDRDGDLALEMSVNLDFGVSRANLDDWFDWWSTILEGFSEEVIGSDAVVPTSSARGA